MEFRIAVGSQSGRRSTIWKFDVQGNEIYILTRMFGSDCKVSLHSSGQCQFSGTSSWVMRVPGRRNADRHIKRWAVEWPIGKDALHVFRVHIPESELRVIGDGEDFASVTWLPAPVCGNSVVVECYVTPITDQDPSLLSALPYALLQSMRLRNGRWLVLLHTTEETDSAALERVREEIRTQCRSEGLQLKPAHRASALGVNNKNLHALTELCVA